MRKRGEERAGGYDLKRDAETKRHIVQGHLPISNEVTQHCGRAGGKQLIAVNAADEGGEGRPGWRRGAQGQSGGDRR